MENRHFHKENGPWLSGSEHSEMFLSYLFTDLTFFDVALMILLAKSVV